MENNKKFLIIGIVVIVVIAIILLVVYFMNLQNSGDVVENEVEENVVEEIEESYTEDLGDIEYEDITVYTEDGTEVKLSDFKDSSVMIVFWDPEDEDSITLIEKIEELYETYEDDVVFMLISSSEEVSEELKDSISAEIYYDLDNDAISTYDIQELPSMIYIYHDNTIFNAKKGNPSTDAIEANLDLLTDNI